MTLLKEIIPVGTTFFRSMPTTIWGSVDLESVDIDMQLQLQNMVASPLTEYYKTDITTLANMVFHKYETNWQKIWDTVRADYDTFITSTTEENFTHTENEVRDIDRNVTRETTEETTETTDTDTVTDNTTVSNNTNSNSSDVVNKKWGLGASTANSDTESEETSTGTSNQTDNFDSTIATDSQVNRDLTQNNSETDETDINATTTITENRTIEGSSPLRTFQALINEEIDGRSGTAWNAYQLFIDDVRRELTLKIWV